MVLQFLRVSGTIFKKLCCNVKKTKDFLALKVKLNCEACDYTKKISFTTFKKRKKKTFGFVCEKKLQKKICGMKNNENVFATILSLNTCLVVLQPRLDLIFS